MEDEKNSVELFYKQKSNYIYVYDGYKYKSPGRYNGRKKSVFLQ